MCLLKAPPNCSLGWEASCSAHSADVLLTLDSRVFCFEHESTPFRLKIFQQMCSCAAPPQINPEAARAEFRSAVSSDAGSGVKDFMDSMGVGGWLEQLSELKLGELLDTPPPGLDEAVAIAKASRVEQNFLPCVSSAGFVCGMGSLPGLRLHLFAAI